MISEPGFAMPPVDLPSKIILDVMFEKVGHPSAAYSARVIHHGCLEVTVDFHPIASELERPVSQTYISTSAFIDLEEAQNHVAHKAMEFMEQEHNVVPSDYNYAKLQSARLNNEALRQRLKERDQSIEALKKVNTSLVQQLAEKSSTLESTMKKNRDLMEKLAEKDSVIEALNKDNKTLHKELDEKMEIIKSLSKGWDNSLDTGFSATTQLQRLIDETMSPGSTDTEIELNATLLSAQKIYEYLEQNTILAVEYLQSIGTYPYEPKSGCTDDEDNCLVNPESVPPEHQPYMRSILDDEEIFDSEGNCSADFDTMPEEHC
ncbi:unnamed protein product [Triticum turgidum subsp. durum]|uniref:Uncharacterized protein n=1 Tax=Triticum turgidum subsp. durum TaxID=4567 RepID=A0A9R0RQL8_TRITD|nr:unnamed protein product [Triticum turgidum subsp. durum]